MPGTYRSAVLLAVLILAVCAPAAATTTGATVLGAGFSGKPFVLEGDVVMETTGIYESIRDYHDADQPTWIGWYAHTLDGIWEELLYDDGLLVALRNPLRPGFEVVDLTDPANPTALAALDGNFFASGHLRDHALLVAGEDYLLAYDLVDPTDPVFASFQTLGVHDRPRWFSDPGPALFLIDHGAHLRVLDVTDLLQPVDLGTVELAGARLDALAAGDGVLYALLAGDGAASLDLVTYDVTDPLAPVEVGRLVHATTPGTVGLQLRRAGDLLLVADDGGQLRAYDIADPTRPVAGWQRSLNVEHLTISDSRILAMTDQDVRIFPRTTAFEPPGDPVVRTLLPRLHTIDGEGPLQLGQLQDPGSMLVPFDAANPHHPRIGQPFDTGLDGTFFYADGLGLMLTLNGSFRLVGLDDPTEPIPLGAVDNPRVRFFRAALAREVAVIETGSVVLELRFYDLADPTAPYMRSKVYDYGLHDIEDDLLICSRSNILRFYDISDLSHPYLVRQHEMPAPVYEARLHQGHAYVLTQDLSGARTLHAVRVTDPLHPETVAALPIDHSAGRIDGHQGRLYVYGYHLCQILDVAVPEAMTVVAEFPALGHTGRGLAFNDDVTTVGGWLVTMRDDGFNPLPVPDHETMDRSVVSLEPAWPNPLNPATTVAFTLDRERQLALTVHDVRGRLVARLAAGVFTPGRHEVRWNGTDTAGRAAASGVYLVRLHGEGLDASTTVTVVK